MSIKKNLTNGIARENPVFRLVLGTCPTLATSLSVSNAIGMGLAATLVLVGSNAIISALRHVIPDKVRIPAYIVVIAAFVTIVDKLMAAFVPSIHSVLGIFIPLIVVNCIILARAEAFASKNSVLNSMADGLGMGMGFTLSLILMSTIREILGTGKFLVAKDFGFAGLELFGEKYALLVLQKAPGGFITFGLLMALINLISNFIAKRREVRANAR
jgi:electron transport complex protein RnfE